MATATGAHTVRLWLDQLLLEQSARPNTPPKYHWHTERSRWKTCACDLMVTAWIPLTEIIPNLGPLTLVRHTARHQWLNLPNNYQPDPNDLLPAPLQPGDALLFCWHTVHGNPPNFSQKPRRALAAHFALNQINYQPHGNFSHHNEKVVSQSKNLPNFQDPHVCPLLKINPPSNKNHYKYIKC
ncbi:MAG: phytanoyl-CoA dioxygenase family protein [Verrucomicrobiota bacterium]